MSQSSAFPTTRWTSVHHAGQGGADGADALARLLPRYLRPLRAHLVLQRKIPPDKAEDLLQSFVAEKVLERNLVGGAVRESPKPRARSPTHARNAALSWCCILGSGQGH